MPLPLGDWALEKALPVYPYNNHVYFMRLQFVSKQNRRSQRKEGKNMYPIWNDNI